MTQTFIFEIVPAYAQIQIKGFLLPKNLKLLKKFFQPLCFVFNSKVELFSFKDFATMKKIIKIFGSFLFLSSVIGMISQLITNKLTIEMWQPEISHKTALFIIFFKLCLSCNSVYRATLIFIFDALSLMSSILIQTYAKYMREVFSNEKFNESNGKSIIVKKVQLHLNLK